MLNAAPAGPLPATLIGALDYLCVNEHEAEIVGASLGISASSPEGFAREIERRHSVSTIVTLGSAGAVGFHGGERFAAPAPPVEVVDTTGAGDTFVGAFAASLDRGLGFADAMRRGLSAGSLACAKAGAQTSMPYAAAIEKLAASLS